MAVVSVAVYVVLSARVADGVNVAIVPEPFRATSSAMERSPARRHDADFR